VDERGDGGGGTASALRPVTDVRGTEAPPSTASAGDRLVEPPAGGVEPPVGGVEPPVGGRAVEPRPSPAHRAVPRIGGARPGVALAIAAAMGSAVLVIASGGYGPASPAPAGPTTVSAVAAPTGTAAAPVTEAAAASTDLPADLRATAVALPTIGVRSALVALDVGSDGALEAPEDPDVAGWFVRGAAPGEPGPTVIAGHVDSRSGPAVFYRLDQLRPGDRVEVTRSDGQVLAYRVATVEQHPKNAFPTARVYGPTPGPELHLITCGGDFDRRIRHYRDNVVVTAIPVP
jgi:Sortase domain